MGGKKRVFNLVSEKEGLIIAQEIMLIYVEGRLRASENGTVEHVIIRTIHEISAKLLGRIKKSCFILNSLLLHNLRHL